jgi:hypothetical protein
MESNLNRIILKDDAKQLTDAQIQVLILNNTLDQLDVCLDRIRTQANQGYYAFNYSVPGIRFKEEVFDKVEGILIKAGYGINRHKNAKQETTNFIILWDK